MKKAGLLGHPINHSLSPAIHNAAYAALGLDWHYDLYPQKSSVDFIQFLKDVQVNTGDYIGFNVTTPYKVAALVAATAMSTYAQVAGSANVLTLNKTSNALMADNSDGRGLVASLEHDADVVVADQTVLLCGGGAVAMSGMLSLLEAKVGKLLIACRDTAQVQARINKVLSYTDMHDAYANIQVVNLNCINELCKSQTDEALLEQIHNTTILIDATTVGMNHETTPVVPVEILHANMVVLDVVYGHGQTALITAAKNARAHAIDGLGMLIEQAALTIEIWASEQELTLEAPRDKMRKAATSNT